MKRLKIDCKDYFVRESCVTNELVAKYAHILEKNGAYALHNKKDGKYYIGSTIVSLKDRLFENGSSHRYLYLRGEHRFINKSNISDFEIIILAYGDIDVRKVEKRYVRMLKTYLPERGYNLTTTGGFGGKYGSQHGTKNLINQTGTSWVTNRTNGKSCKVFNAHDIPEGYYPGKYGVSYCKNLDDELNILSDRTCDSEIMDITITRTDAVRYCCSTKSYTHRRLIKALEKFYNINLHIN